MNLAIIIPVLNVQDTWSELAEALTENLAHLKIGPECVLIIDSESTDNTSALVRQSGFKLRSIRRKDFNHGGTRQLGVDMVEADVVVFLTQDALLASSHSIARLLEPFSDPKVAAVYGRQLPAKTARPIEAHARHFNYPTVTSVRDLASRESIGFKSIFFSNSFGAYRRDALKEIGGFSSNLIFGEDTVAVGRFHLAGWKTVYCAEASVYHSHSYTALQQLRRYFDIGVLHAREKWLLDNFHEPGGAGFRFLRSEIVYLWRVSPLAIIDSLLQCAAKLVGYSLGRREHMFANGVKARLSMSKSYWTR